MEKEKKESVFRTLVVVDRYNDDGTLSGHRYGDENALPVVLKLSEEGPEAANSKRPSFEHFKNGKGKMPPVLPGGVLEVKTRKPLNSEGVQSVLWGNRVSSSPEETAALKQCLARVIKTTDKSGKDHYQVRTFEGEGALSDKANGKWGMAMVRLREGANVIARATVYMKPDEPQTVGEKLPDVPGGKEFLEVQKNHPEAAVEVLKFENRSMTATDNLSEDKRTYLDNLATRKLVSGGEPVEDNRFKPLVLVFSPSSPETVNNVLQVGRPGPVATLLPLSPGPSLSWKEEKKPGQEAAQEAEATQGELIPSPEAETAEPTDSLSEDLYQQEEMSMS